MDPLNTQKKPAMAIQKNLQQQDWHNADIKAALEKAGWTLRKLAIARGYAPGVLRNPLNRPWPAGERVIADALSTTPQAIWPSRYRADGTSKSGRNERGIGVYKRKSTTQEIACNVEVVGAV
jgi:Ner family transcriptional regulator